MKLPLLSGRLPSFDPIRLLPGLLTLWLGTLTAHTAPKPIALHPDNPHYFLWRGKPTLLITSGEHYGAVLNADFDYRKYLATLAADKLNHTRTWSGGPYLEPQGAFNIARNTLAPAPGRFLSCYARSEQPGFAGGGNKFDLSRWDEAFFRRLHDFMRHASRRGIVVEMNLFCPMYEEKQWVLSPYSTNNNVNGLGNIGRNEVFTLDRHGGLGLVQERLVRKFVDELKDYDNLYYEVMNEPYATGVPMNWQEHIAEVIEEAQRKHPRKKLISLNIANNAAVVKDPHPAISIFNFHYATPPSTVAMNYHLNKVIGDNETGFRGTKDAAYRMEGWDFLLAGGGLYNNLDYSFTVGHEDGTFAAPATQPGGGNPTFRRQMRILRDFMHRFDFIRMQPDNSIIKGGVPAAFSARALAEKGRAYALYFRPLSVTQVSVRWTGQREAPATDADAQHTNQGTDFQDRWRQRDDSQVNSVWGTRPPFPAAAGTPRSALELELPFGRYVAEWVSPITGGIVKTERFEHPGGIVKVAAPPFTEDIALRIAAR